MVVAKGSVVPCLRTHVEGPVVAVHGGSRHPIVEARSVEAHAVILGRIKVGRKVVVIVAKGVKLTRGLTVERLSLMTLRIGRAIRGMMIVIHVWMSEIHGDGRQQSGVRCSCQGDECQRVDSLATSGLSMSILVAVTVVIAGGRLAANGKTQRHRALATMSCKMKLKTERWSKCAKVQRREQAMRRHSDGRAS